MARTFRFQHGSSIAGAFVLFAFVLLIAAFFLAGRTQGWFEGRYELTARFVDTDGSLSEEGTFGLQEGSLVTIMNTPAGRIERIMPTASGHMEATLSLQNRFRPFVREDSPATVRRKWGLAGDAVLEISPGRGIPLEPESILYCSRDTELMETAQSVLTDLQGKFLPVLDQTYMLASNLNRIAVSVDQGNGTVARLLHDPALPLALSNNLAHAEKLLLNLNRISTGLAAGEGLAGDLLTGERLLHEWLALLNHTQQTLQEGEAALREIRLLTEGVQQHWLFRDKVTKVRERQQPRLLPLTVTACEANAMLPELGQLYRQARRTKREDALRALLWDEAVCLLELGRIEDATHRADEASLYADSDNERGALLALQSEILRRQGNPEEANRRLQDARHLLNRRTPAAIRALVAGTEAMLQSQRLDATAVRRAQQDLERVQHKLNDDRSVIFAARTAGQLYAAQDAREQDAAEAFLQAAAAAAQAGLTPLTLELLEQAAASFRRSDQADRARACLLHAAGIHWAEGRNNNATHILLQLQRENDLSAPFAGAIRSLLARMNNASANTNGHTQP